MTTNIRNFGKTGCALLAALGLLLAAAPLFAHHSTSSEFDNTKQWSVTGTLSRIDWVNPHTATWVDVKDPKTGKVESWGCQGYPPAMWHRAGLKKDDWRVGEEVTMTCSPSRNGSPRWGYIKTLKYNSDGRVMVFDSDTE